MIWQKPNSAIIHLTDFNMNVIKYCIYLTIFNPGLYYCWNVIASKSAWLY